MADSPTVFEETQIDMQQNYHILLITWNCK
jgi:hypothetical protein